MPHGAEKQDQDDVADDEYAIKTGQVCRTPPR